jgi:hypothetical protein
MKLILTFFISFSLSFMLGFSVSYLAEKQIVVFENGKSVGQEKLFVWNNDKWEEELSSLDE